MTREGVRSAWANSGLTYDDLTRDRLQRLRTLINDEMKASGRMNGTFRCLQRAAIFGEDRKPHKTGPVFFAEIKCKSFYFEKREAVSFNPDGFIGFAGWADESNVWPILSGFTKWLKEVAP